MLIDNKKPIDMPHGEYPKIEGLKEILFYDEVLYFVNRILFREISLSKSRE